MIIDGRKIAEDIYTDIRLSIAKSEKMPKLVIVTCMPNFETKKYLALKEKKAKEVGIETIIIELEETITTDDIIRHIQEMVALSDGIVVQLPLPAHIDRDRVIASIPPSHDIDALNPKTNTIYSPVVGACEEILRIQNITPHDKQVTIVGAGTLVGLPAYQWFSTHGAHVSLVTRDTKDISFYTRNADIIVCGVGVPGILTPSMIKDGVIIFDAGTSEDNGELRGDADPACADTARIFTPVPGGIGPITIAILLRNVVKCAFMHEHMI
jgi:methylenetetrahydrofolate dehydrogenase (NADP+) / methenyltetrahydrofolate cyclohydrolase